MAFIKWIKGLFTKPKKTVLQKSVAKVKSCEEGGVCPINVNPAPVTRKGELWYPKAKRAASRMKARGKFKGDYPLGILVHYTAGRSGGLSKALDSISGGIKNGFLFACIADTGEFVQANPMNEHGYHAGESKWKFPGFSGTVSDETFGIEMNNAGQVKKNKKGNFDTWFGTELKPHEVRYVEKKDYGCPTGYYHKYTEAQEKTLIEFIVWAIKNDPTGRLTWETVLGHHEVAGVLGIGYFRKPDPGGALSMTMPQLRQLIKELTT